MLDFIGLMLVPVVAVIALFLEGGSENPPAKDGAGEPPSPAPGQAAGEQGGEATTPPPGDTPGAGEEATPPTPQREGEFTPEQQQRVDRIITDRLERDRRSRADDRQELQGQLEAMRDAEEARQQAEMTELERAQATEQAAREELVQLRADSEAAQLQLLRTETISRVAGTLPHAYQSLVEGATVEEIEASIEDVKTTFNEDTLRILTEAFRDVAVGSVEEIAQKYGEEPTKALCERLQGQPPSIGSPSTGAGGVQPPPPPADVPIGNMNAEQLKADLAKQGVTIR